MMAGIDKIYGTREQRRELKRFLVRHKKRAWFRYIYPPFKGEIGPISNFNTKQDRWLYKHCTFEWVQRRLAEQYNDLAALAAGRE